jgi:hypothetical protein
MLRRNYFNAAKSPETVASGVVIEVDQRGNHIGASSANAYVGSSGVGSFLPGWAASYGGMALYALPIVGFVLLLVMFKLIKWFIARRRAAVIANHHPEIVSADIAPGMNKHVRFQEKVDIKNIKRIAGGGVSIQEEKAKIDIKIDSNGSSNGFLCGIKKMCWSCVAYLKAWSCAVTHQAMRLVHLILMPWKLMVCLMRRLVGSKMAADGQFANEASNLIIHEKLKLTSMEIGSLFSAEQGNVEEIMNKVTAESSGWMLPMITSARAAGNMEHVADLERAYALLNASGGVVTA